MSSKASTTAKPAASKKRSKAIDSETKKNIQKVIEIEAAQIQNRSFGERLSEFIAEFCGSMTFVWVHVIWFGTWIVINSGIPGLQFDPFPYTFLTLVVSLEAIFLSTFILISQNHDTRLSEQRNHLDLQINMLAEQESTKTLELLRRVAEKVGVKADDPAMDSLLEDMEPSDLVEQIRAEAESKIESAAANGTEPRRKKAAD